MRKITTAAMGLAVAAGGSAFAAEATFENHLMSAPMVSPAQIYQIEDVTTDVGLGYSSKEESSKADGADKMSDERTDTNLFAAGIYNIRAIDLRAGVSVNYKSIAFEGDTVDSAGAMGKYDAEGSEMTFTPQVAYSVGPMVIGAALDVVQREVDVDSETSKSQHMTFRPGALFRSDVMEAGMTYSSPTRKTAEKAEELDVEEAAKVTAHGRYALNRDFAAGAILTNVNHKAIDEDLYKDQTQVKGTGEYRMGATKLEGQVGYNTAFYKDDEVMSAETIGTILLGAGADYAVNKATTVGGGLDYEFGSDKNDASEIENNTLTLAVRGNMTF